MNHQYGGYERGEGLQHGQRVTLVEWLTQTLNSVQVFEIISGLIGTISDVCVQLPPSLYNRACEYSVYAYTSNHTMMLYAHTHTSTFVHITYIVCTSVRTYTLIKAQEDGMYTKIAYTVFQ